MENHSYELPKYSIAIRTLGTAGDKFVKEIDSILRQSHLPDKIVIYIAKGYAKPNVSHSLISYVEVDKGMVAQRALQYDEIDTEYLLCLDDDMLLSNTFAAEILKFATDNDADCIGCDTFRNYKSTFVQKAYNFIVNMAVPIRSSKWGIKVLPNGSFAYNSAPLAKHFYLSQSGEGTNFLIKKSAMHGIDFASELWLDRCGYAYGDDQLFFYKLHSRGFKVGYVYGMGIEHLNACASSSAYKQSPERFRKRAFGILTTWHRSCYAGRNIFVKANATMAFASRVMLMTPAHLFLSIKSKNPKIIIHFFGGLKSAVKFTHKHSYKDLPKYCNSKANR